MANKADREIRREARRLDRNICKDFDRDEKRLAVELKREIQKNGGSEKSRRLAKQLIRIREARGKVENIKGHMETLATGVKVQAANAAMTETLGKTAKVMSQVNKNMNTQKVMKNMAKYQNEMAKSKMTQEIMEDTLDDVFDSEDAELQQDDLINQVLDEIGLQRMDGMGTVPQGASEKIENTPTKEVHQMLSEQ